MFDTAFDDCDVCFRDDPGLLGRAMEHALDAGIVSKFEIVPKLHGNGIRVLFETLAGEGFFLVPSDSLTVRGLLLALANAVGRVDEVPRG